MTAAEREGAALSALQPPVRDRGNMALVNNPKLARLKRRAHLCCTAVARRSKSLSARA
jgi:hypothetical protein